MDNINLAAIGSRLKEIRKSLKLKQPEFSAKLGVSQSFLSGVEQGSLKPSFQLLLSLYTIYNVNINWLLTGDEDIFSTSESSEKKRDIDFGIFQKETEELLYLVENVDFVRFHLLEELAGFKSRYKEKIDEHLKNKELTHMKEVKEA
jgi:transcriptional regulator with XRE-family HTH domain